MYIKPLDPHYAHLTLSPWHGGALLRRGCILSGDGMDLAVNETTVGSVELEPTFTSCAEPVRWKFKDVFREWRITRKTEFLFIQV